MVLELPHFMTRFFILRFWMLSLLAVFGLPACAQQAGTTAPPDTLFFEAENFTVQGNGWKPQQNAQAKRASLGVALNGASGDVKSTATQIVQIPRAGTWRIWVRYMVHGSYRGPFEMDVLSGENVLASHAFDVATLPPVEDWDYRWESFDVELPASGEYSLRLRKHQDKNVSGYARNVDAVLLTQDLEQKPDHIPFGPQTWMKVTLGDGYEKPVQIHIFADHYRSPWYAHYAVSKDGMEDGLNPKRKEALLSNGETTGWVNISRTIYQDSGAHLVMYPAFRYGDNAPRFKATIEFAAAPGDAEAVKKFVVDYAPSTMHIVVPPSLETPENIARLRSDKEFAAEYGKIADNLDWPKIGKAPQKFPFFVSASLDPDTLDAGVLQRELKTLAYFGFNGIGSHRFFEKNGFPHKSIGGVGWFMKDSYSAPETDKMRERAAALYKNQTEAGIAPSQIDFAMVMDEPTGEPAAKLATDEASIEGFRNWLKSKNLSPQDLLVASWDEVKPIAEKERDQFPALHFYTQKYRTVALGNFLAIQKQLLKEEWKTDFPVVANFSDGAIYYGNFYGQGVDYFTLLHETDQNAIWSEDWSNNAATYQDATFNVELMRAAARKNGQWMGHHLIAYAGRTGYDVRLKAVSEAARGVKAFESFAYGPVWATHESSPWQKNVPIWKDHASVVREIGAVEDWLMPAKPQKAEVALLYSSASDAWNIGQNLASGFDRMHTWLALTHAQIPVDVVHENEIEDGVLANYKVAYCSDPNLTRAAAQKLADWVRSGGTLVLAVGAGERDEYNRPLKTLDELLSFKRNPTQTLQAFQSAGRFLTTLKAQDVVNAGAAKIEVLSQKQTFENVPQNGVTVEAKFADGSPASLKSAVGKGAIICHGFFPALDYMRQALLAKNGVQDRAQELNENNGIPGPDDVLPLKINEKSYNPWQYSAAVRDVITQPVRAAKIKAPIVCSVPLVDAVYLNAPQGVLIPLANYTLQPIAKMTLEIAVEKPVREVRSVHAGVLPFEKIGANKIRVSLPLECTDFLTIQ
jgi:hypothetical protein